MSKIINGDKLFEEGKKKELFDSLFKDVLEFIEKNAYNTSPDGDRIKQIEALKEENEELYSHLKKKGKHQSGNNTMKPEELGP